MDQISGLSQKCPDFSFKMSGILYPRILTFWNSAHFSRWEALYQGGGGSKWNILWKVNHWQIGVADRNPTTIIGGSGVTGGAGWLYLPASPVMLPLVWSVQGRSFSMSMVPEYLTSSLNPSGMKMLLISHCLKTTWIYSWQGFLTNPPRQAWSEHQLPTVCWTRFPWSLTWILAKWGILIWLL